MLKSQHRITTFAGARALNLRPQRLWLLSLAASLALSACSKPEVVAEPVRAVKLLTVAATTDNNTAEFAGETRARVESRLGFRVAGKVTARSVEVGQIVRPGQVLAQIDAQDYALGAQAAQAQTIAAQTQRDLAQAELKRFQSLREQNFISAAELDRREAALRAADATLAQAKAQAQVQSNQSSYTQLRATQAGVVTALEAEVGQVLAAGQTVLRLALEGPRDAVFSVPEQAVMAFQVGQTMQAELVSTHQTFTGTIREVAAAADPITRTYLVKLALSGSERLPLGATVNIKPTGAAPKVANLQLPTSALLKSSDPKGAQSSVWVFDEASSTVRAQPVTVAGVVGNRVVISQGLNGGERVVAAGVHVLTAGQKVMPYVGDPGVAADGR